MAYAAGRGAGASLAPSPTLTICRHFNTPTGCRRPDCRALHVCFYFVTSQCRFGARCRLPHSLETERTAALLRQLGVPASRRQPLQLLTELRRQYSSAAAAGTAAATATADSTPRVCLHYNGGGCLAADCDLLHICYLLVTGRCQGRRCTRSHSLTTVHNARVLRLSGLRDTAVSAVLSQLRQEAVRRPLRPAVCRRYSSRAGCVSGDCLSLHCCFFFARGDCSYGFRCRLEHQLSGAHNRRVLRFFDVDAASALQGVREELQTIRDELHDTGAVPGATAGTEAVSRLLEQQLERQEQLEQQQQLEQTLQTVAQLGLEAERELADSRRVGLSLQVEAEHLTLVAEERERELTARQSSLLAERDSLERSLLVTAESSDQLETVVSGLSAKLSVLEVDYRRSREEQQRLAAALEQERRLQRQQQERREEELERTLVCSVCLEMFVRATTLGCSHTFCRGCVTSIQQHGGGALCPMCRAPIRSQTASITLDQMVERAVRSMSEEKRAARQAVLRERGLPETL